MKDNFSRISPLYAQFRPTYPRQLYDFLLTLVPGRSAAWDCGTGNGQVAVALADDFDKLFATDISANQLSNAVRRNNIFYSIQSAEQTSFSFDQFDLVIAAQAAHWFDFQKYFVEVDRTLKQGGVFAIIGYSHVEFGDIIDQMIHKFKNDIIGSYWDKERKYVDERYSTIPFPYTDIQFPPMFMRYEWTLKQLLGYLHTWSAVQHYIDRNRTDPVDLIIADLEKTWGDDETKEATFPLFARIGRKGG
jgi:SAM-dependent methyltransferase